MVVLVDNDWKDEVIDMVVLVDNDWKDLHGCIGG